MGDGLTLVLRNRLEDVGTISQAVEEFFAAEGLAPAAGAQMALALDELATNAVSYGFEPGAEVEGALSITLAHDGRTAWAIFEDTGRAFDPLTVPTPDTSAGLDERSIGGLGLHLVRQIVDEITYERAAGRNRVRLSKRL